MMQSQTSSTKGNQEKTFKKYIFKHFNAHASETINNKTGIIRNQESYNQYDNSLKQTKDQPKRSYSALTGQLEYTIDIFMQANTS